jgi:ribonuclease P protein component
LLKKSDYDHVFSQAKKWANPNFIVLYCKNTIGHPRLGLALSKKMIAKAHDRNRIKRLLRESFRTHRLPDIDVIILARQGVAKVSHSIINDKLSKTWDSLYNS